MALVKYLSSLTKPELEKIKEICHFTDDEELIFEELSCGRSTMSISEKYSLSYATVSNRIHRIKNKINKVK